MRSLALIFGIVFILGLVTPILADDPGAQKVLKEGIIGAGVGAVAASASGGKAGKGALIGAGTNIAGNVIMDILTSGPQQPQQPVQVVPVQPVVPDLYQQGYSAGYQKGFENGYEKGYQAGLAAAKR